MSYSRPLYLTSPQMYGDDIKEVQTKLSQLGFFNGEIDGYFGNITKQAVLAFQQDAGLTADGSCGPATWSRLFRALFYTTPTITGTDVKIAQERLRSLNYYTDSIDGSFGPNCDLAVRAYQSSVGLSCDGSIGPATWNSLFNSNTVNGAISEYTRPLFLTNPIITGNDVTQVQKKLKDLGYYNDSIDGSFGPNTEIAVKSYQSVMNLEIDGSVGPATWNSLFNSNTVNGATSEYTRPLFYTTPVITGNDVAKVQQRLKQLGYYTDLVDGSFGPYTEIAVILFQSSNNLTPDGSVGPLTWNSLFSSSNVIGIGNSLLTGKKIFIDAGHGGNDCGATGKNTAGSLYLEKDFTLTISLEQKRIFESLGYQVMLSRSSDNSVSLESRVNLANSWGADLFISNHINAGGGSGIEAWASIGNSVGQSYASSIVNNVSLNTPLYSRGVKTKTLSDGRDYFCVIRETTMTAILIEYGFIDNTTDLSFLSSIENQNTLARLTVDALTSNISASTSGYTRPLYLTSPQMYGNDVKNVQVRLTNLGYDPGSIDGYFGQNTYNAIFSFQGRNGLTQDGSCGPTTWDKLFSSSAIGNTTSGSIVDTGNNDDTDSSIFISNLKTYSTGITFYLNTGEVGSSSVSNLELKVFTPAGTVYSKVFTSPTQDTLTIPLNYYSQVKVTATKKTAGRIVRAEEKSIDFKLTSTVTNSITYTESDLIIAKNNAALNEIIGFGLGVIGPFGIIYCAGRLLEKVGSIYFAKNPTYINVMDLAYVVPGAKMTQTFIPKSNGDVDIYCTYIDENGYTKFNNQYSTTIYFPKW